MDLLLVLTLLLFGGALTAGILFARKELKKSSKNTYVPQYFPKAPVLPHVPGTNKHGKAKQKSSVDSTTSTSCAGVVAISCGGSSSSSNGGGFGGGDSGGGGSSSSCAGHSSCSGSSCSSGCSSGCGGGGD